MSGHEARINDALRQLGEEYRLGMVQAEEYRSRRRLLLESWNERDATTSPGSLRTRAAATTTNRPPATAAPAAGGTRKPPIAAFVVIGIVVLGAGGWLAWSMGGSRGASTPAVPAQAPLSPEVAGIVKAADDFLAANAWESAAIEGFLLRWRALPPDQRARASEQPSLRTLRYKLDQNIQAETLLVGADAPPEARERLAQLESFARELSGEGS